MDDGWDGHYWTLMSGGDSKESKGERDDEIGWGG
jgi:hypothetical protein